jgi:HD-like signal output (HDOD) protein/CheY-like chemotaxis protein
MTRILFVGDEPGVLEDFERLLRPQAAHWETMFAGGGDAALRMLEAHPCDAVVTGTRLRGIDGAQFLERVRDRFPGVMRILQADENERDATLRALGVAHQFLPKPCDAGCLVRILERAGGPGGTARDASIRRIVGAVGELPCLPRTAAALMRALEDPDIAVSRIGQIVGQDVAISAKVMQLSNSAFFGRSQAVTTIAHAVSVLGIEVLKHLVIAAEIFRAFQPRRHIEGFILDRIQSHSYTVAEIAARLPLPKTKVPAATLAALLHDAGKLVLASRVPLECERIRRLTIGGRLSWHAAEEQVLGVSHAGVGAYLLALWGLPGAIVSAVERHHHPAAEPGDDPPFGAPAAVYFANLLAHEREPAADGESPGQPPPIDQDYLRAVGMEGELPAWRAMAETAGTPRLSAPFPES